MCSSLKEETAQPREAYLASFTVNHRGPASCLGKTALPVPSPMPTATSQLTPSRLAVHCLMPSAKTKLGSKTRGKCSLWLLLAPKAHATTSALAYHQAVGQVSVIPPHHRFFLERKQPKPSIAVLAELRQTLKPAFSQ